MGRESLRSARRCKRTARISPRGPTQLPAPTGLVPMIPGESPQSRPGGPPLLAGGGRFHGPRPRRVGQGRPQAGPEDRAAPLRRPPNVVGSGRAAAKRPVRGRVQGPGCGAAGEVVPTPVSCPGAAGQRDASACNGVGEAGSRWARASGAALGRSAPVSLPVSGLGLAGSVIVEPAGCAVGVCAKEVPGQGGR